jgi:hypothetical protein
MMAPKFLKIETELDKLHKTIDEVIPKLAHKFNGYAFPYEKVKLSLDDFLVLTLHRKTTTHMFGYDFNQQNKEFWLRDEKGLINNLRNAFWWPAVENLWELQCFQADTDKEGLMDVYYLVRIGFIPLPTASDKIKTCDEIYWLGIKTQRCYIDQG